MSVTLELSEDEYESLIGAVRRTDTLRGEMDALADTLESQRRAQAFEVRFRERAAALAHNRWSHWMQYLFSRCAPVSFHDSRRLPAGPHGACLTVGAAPHGPGLGFAGSGHHVCIELGEDAAEELRGTGLFVNNRALLMPSKFVERWSRQANTTYGGLPDEEKESDRREADLMIEMLGEFSMSPADALAADRAMKELSESIEARAWEDADKAADKAAVKRFVDGVAHPPPRPEATSRWITRFGRVFSAIAHEVGLEIDSGNPGQVWRAARACAGVAKVALDWATDTGTCHFCSWKDDAVHDEGCPLRAFAGREGPS